MMIIHASLAQGAVLHVSGGVLLPVSGGAALASAPQAAPTERARRVGVFVGRRREAHHGEPRHSKAAAVESQRQARHHSHQQTSADSDAARPQQSHADDDAPVGADGALAHRHAAQLHQRRPPTGALGPFPPQ